ncbi:MULTISPECIES: CBS domain-containing protein [Actinoallomurus]|uniref:CBS domain-containing protein n=1 Tax=Actinoallomurus TaxID=667113 RepID=UPI002091D4A3|nr:MULTISPECIES: CBS domain-containing protein [Actinoallomurus]MCO5971455.1 CBS domain-containing protein [Actinoallomurus soli]MCO5994092.1 CBS domain-containing protein [Actinoallomurus rhizosphaericola]
MRISEVLRAKGADVATIAPDASVRHLLRLLADRNIGAVVVSADGSTIDGIVSERDIVRRLGERGAALLDAPVSEIMTTHVRTCAPGDAVDGLRVTMTEHRIRHLPVVRDGRLVGIVSIGDVVKSTIAELETEREQLVDYIKR